MGILQLDNGEVISYAGHMVITARDLDGDWDGVSSYSPDDFIAYAQELWDSSGSDKSEPITLREAVEYVRGYNIEVGMGYDGNINDKQGIII